MEESKGKIEGMKRIGDEGWDSKGGNKTIKGGGNERAGDSRKWMEGGREMKEGRGRNSRE